MKKGNFRKMKEAVVNEVGFLWIKVIIFLTLGCAIFLVLQSLLRPRWNYPVFADNPSYSLETFFSQEENSDEVIFLGTSHMLYGVSPMELYKEKGIVGYNLGTAIQSLGGTYYILKEAFEKQSPSVVVLDVPRVFAEESEDACWRYILDGMPMGLNKFEAAIHYAKLGTSNQNDGESIGVDELQERFNSVLFPIIQYHARWNQLNETDFRDYFVENSYYTAGYFLNPYMADYALNEEMMNERAYSYNADTDAWVVEYEYGIKNEEHCEENLYQPEVTEYAVYWIREINELCIQNGATLQLIKIPVISDPLSYDSAWTKLKSEEMKKFAVEEGISFLDLLYDANIGINVRTDYIDAGAHLNYLGTKKVSSYLSDYLSTNYGLGGKVNEAFESNMELYNQMTEVASLELETDFITYLKKLKERAKDYIICMAANGDVSTCLTENDIQALSDLGLQTDFKTYLNSPNSYLALIDGGNVRYEGISHRKLMYTDTIDEQISIEMESFCLYADLNANIFINDINYASNTNGINIVVMDKETGKVIDSVIFDTSIESHKYSHNNVLNLMNNYWMAKKELQK